jgi:3-oxoacyl-ACP reductase-like protein
MQPGATGAAAATVPEAAATVREAAAATAPGEGDEQEILRLQDILALIPLVSRSKLTLIEGEDDTRSWGNFLVYFSHNTHNAIPS